MAEELYKVRNFVLEIEDGKDMKELVIRNHADTWRLVIRENNGLYGYWLNIVEEARHQMHIRAALESTITLMFAMSSIGVFDVKTSNDLAAVLHDATARIAAALDKQIDKLQEEADAKEWAERQQTLEEMSDEVKKAGDGGENT